MTKSSRMTRKLLKLQIIFFLPIPQSLNIAENNALLNRTDDLTNPVDIALKKFKNHPSIIDIKEKITVEAKFSFSKVDIITEIRKLDTKSLRE